MSAPQANFGQSSPYGFSDGTGCLEGDTVKTNCNVDVVILNLNQGMRTTSRDVTPSPKHHTNGRTLSFDRFNDHRLPLHCGSSVELETGITGSQARDYYL
ncbi:hypothetical protein TNCV_3351831 [Trichonephila clavipes]|nr:hypothetical protein TNCV_3351831 [Trichonephila clavipes]